MVRWPGGCVGRGRGLCGGCWSRRGARAGRGRQVCRSDKVGGARMCFLLFFSFLFLMLRRRERACEDGLVGGAAGRMERACCCCVVNLC